MSLKSIQNAKIVDMPKINVGLGLERSNDSEKFDFSQTTTSNYLYNLVAPVCKAKLESIDLLFGRV